MRPLETMPDGRGHFGPYGGMFVPETLMTALEELTAEYESARGDPNFQWELDTLLHDFLGRPTPLCYAKRLTQKLAGAKIYLKREDLLLGVLQGTKTFILANDDGQIELTHSVSTGLDYAAIGPEHSYLRDQGRIETILRLTPKRSPPFAGSRNWKELFPRWKPPTPSRT
jgi:tryptophan synthase beta subunit